MTVLLAFGAAAALLSAAAFLLALHALATVTAERARLADLEGWAMTAQDALPLRCPECHRDLESELKLVPHPFACPYCGATVRPYGSDPRRRFGPTTPDPRQSRPL